MGSEEKMPRKYVLAYWLGHCRSCGHQADYLYEIQSKILGTVMICKPCADKVGLLSPPVARKAS